MCGLTIVFDYSGTLSLEAVAFGKSDALERQLHLSGLADFGVASPDIFWNTIVNPTWEKGSRTPIGYRRLMVDKISEELTARRKDSSLADLDRAAGIFVGQYFSHSPIDPSWRPLLRELYNHPRITNVVATDHYAEATEAIKDQFRDMQMKAVSLPAGGGAKVRDKIGSASVTTDSKSCFFVANSADLGYHKDEEEFWVRVREETGWTPGDRLLLVDDFGANEIGGDLYGQEARVAKRWQGTKDLLTKVFAGRVEVVPFVLSGDETSGNGEAHLLIGKIAVSIRESLREGGCPHV
ncbi:MAG TPA: hypothetical protein DCG53_08910 [Syntrophus sp. (in: bacteria)]|nr:hypothetical protein [Syntrophus sp. (in: bacteria)]